MDMITRINHKTIPGILISLLLLLAITISSDAQAAPELYFIHNDHLGTPLAVTDQNQNIVWRKRQKPFGEMMEDTGTQDPQSRFPGQYFDEETGYHYNYFRDYDPSLGRYIQSDPIGLEGGLNTYGYVLGNPLIFFDSKGLNVSRCIMNPHAPGCQLSFGGGGGAAVPSLLCLITGACEKAAEAIGQCLVGEDSEENEEDDNCEALYQSILATCAGLTGRKKFKCFEAARIARDQCYQER